MTEKFYTSVNVFTKHYTGLVIVKHFSSDSIYIGFVNEIGFKYFEFQVIKNQFQMLYSFGNLKSSKAALMIIDNLRLLLFISKIKPRIIPNRTMPQYCQLTQKEIILDATHKILFSATNTCLFSNKIWLVKKSRKRMHGEFRNGDQLIFTKHQILPIRFKFKSID